MSYHNEATYKTEKKGLPDYDTPGNQEKSKPARMVVLKVQILSR